MKLFWLLRCCVAAVMSAINRSAIDQLRSSCLAARQHGSPPKMAFFLSFSPPLLLSSQNDPSGPAGHPVIQIQLKETGPIHTYIT
jgi:hypothetical protein